MEGGGQGHTLSNARVQFGEEAQNKERGKERRKKAQRKRKQRDGEAGSEADKRRCEEWRNAGFKGSSLIWNSSCAELFCFACGALCPFCISVLGSGLSDNVSFSCTLLGMLAYYSSNSCCFSKAFSMSVYSTLVVGSPAISVDVFYSVHLSLCSNKAKHVALSNTGPLV